MPSFYRSYVDPSSRPRVARIDDSSDVAYEPLRTLTFYITGVAGGIQIQDCDRGTDRTINIPGVSIDDMCAVDSAVNAFLREDYQREHLMRTHGGIYRPEHVEDPPQPIRINPFYRYVEADIPTRDFSGSFMARAASVAAASILDRRPDFNWTFEAQPQSHDLIAPPTLPRPRKKRHYLVWTPFSSYTACATCFIDRDLKAMRVRILRVLRYLDTQHTHPRRAAELWRGHEQSLIRYGITIALECRRRGFRDSSLQKFRVRFLPGLYQKPEWIFWTELQESHQAYLLLREERRMMVFILGQVRQLENSLSSRGIMDFCNSLNVPYKSQWAMHDIQSMRSALQSRYPFIRNGANFYLKYFRPQAPNESIRYPKDNICLA